MASAAQHKLTVQLTAQVDAAYKSALEQARTAVADLKSEIDTLRDSANNLKEYQDMQNELQTLTAKLQALQQQYTDTQTQMQNSSGSWTSLNSVLASLSKQITTTEAKIAAQTTAVQQQQDKIAALKEQYAALQEKQANAADGTTNYTGELAKLEKEISTAEAQLAKQTNQLEQQKSSLDVLNTKYAETKEQMQNATGAAKSWDTALVSLQKEINTVKTQIAEKKAQLEQLAAKLNSAGVSTDNLSASEQKLRDEYDRLSAELKAAEAALEQLENKKKQAIANAEAEAEATAKSQEAQKKYAESAEDAGDSTETFGSKLATIATGALLSFGQSLEQWAISKLSQIPELFEECIDAAIEFESAITGVAKTTDFSTEELEEYADAIQDLATVLPESTTDLAAVSEVAGQLGIASEDILSFTEVMAMLGTATNMTSDTAATYLAQMANITQMDTDYYENLASAIVYLGNNYATTEEKIVKTSQRIAASASIAGMTEAEIVGISAAVGSLGIEAMVGGTTVTSVITDITTAVGTASEDVENYAWAAGMSVNEFMEAWEEDAASTFAAVITGLSDIDRLGVKSTTEALQNIGITEDRATRVMLSLATSGDLLTNAIADANAAWEENTALVEEAELRYETTESRITIFKNSLEVLMQSVGEKFTPFVAKLADFGTEVVTTITSWIDGSDLLQDEYDELTDELSDWTTLEGAIEEYQSLTAALEAGALTAEEEEAAQEALLTAKETLIENVPDYISAIYSENEILEEQLGLLTAIAEGQVEYTASEIAENLQDQADEAAEAYERQQEAIAGLEKATADLSEIKGLITLYGEGESGIDGIVDYMRGEYETLQEELAAGVTIGGIDITGYDDESALARYQYVSAFLEKMSTYATALTGTEVSFDTADLFGVWLDSDLSNLTPDTLLEGYAILVDEVTAYSEVVADSEETQTDFFNNLAEMVSSGTYTEAYAQWLIKSRYGTEGAEWATEQYENALYELQAAAEDTGDSLEDYTDNTVGTADAMEMLDGAAADLAQAVAEGQISYDAAASSILTMGENLGQGEYAAEAFNSAMNDAVATMYEADSAADWASEEIDSLTESIQDLIDEWEGYYDTAAGALSLFEDMTPDEDEETESASDLLAALQSQIDYYAEYLANIEKLQSLGLNESLLGELLSGSSTDADYLAALAEAPELIEQINAAWEESEEAKDMFAETLADMQLDMDEAMQNLVDSSQDAIEQMNLSSEAADAAYETMEAYIAELEEGGSKAYTTALYYANLIASAFDGQTITYTATVSGSSATEVTDAGTESGYGYAEGGYAVRKQLAWVAEDEPEYMIPVNNSARSVYLWQKAGEDLGVMNTSYMNTYQSIPTTNENSSYNTVSYAPAVSITVNGNADNSTVADIQRVVVQTLNDQQRRLKRMHYA